VNDSELGLTDIVGGSTVTRRVTCPVIGQKLAGQFTVTVPEYEPAGKLAALIAMARLTCEGATGMVPAVGLTDNQTPPEFVEAEAAKFTGLPLERASCQLVAEQDKLPVLRSYVQDNGVSVDATWPLLSGTMMQSRTPAAVVRRAFLGLKDTELSHRQDDWLSYITQPTRRPATDT
jgi:hypothetical protein